jgi:hypothetical protein
MRFAPPAQPAAKVLPVWACCRNGNCLNDAMASHALRRYPAASDLPRWIGTGAIAGAVSVIVFQQGTLALLYALGLTVRAPYSMELTAPWGILSLWSFAFWGAIWGAVLAATLARLDGARLVLAAVVFGAVLPTLVAFLLVAPLKGQPTVTGIVPLAVLAAVLVNAAWGLGTGLGLAFFGRPRTPSNSTPTSS